MEPTLQPNGEEKGYITLAPGDLEGEGEEGQGREEKLSAENDSALKSGGQPDEAAEGSHQLELNADLCIRQRHKT